MASQSFLSNCQPSCQETLETVPINGFLAAEDETNVCIQFRIPSGNLGDPLETELFVAAGGGGREGEGAQMSPK